MAKFFGFQSGARVVVEAGGQKAGVAAWGLERLEHEFKGIAGKAIGLVSIPHAERVAFVEPSPVGRLVEAQHGLALFDAPQGIHSFEVEVTDVDPTIAPRRDTVIVDVEDPTQVLAPGAPFWGDYSWTGMPTDGWATGANVYMLPRDAEDNIVVEPGQVHRRVYVSSSEGMSRQDIAQHAGVSLGVIYPSWLASNPQYGSSPEMAVDQEVADMIWQQIAWNKKCSHWLLFRRGDTFSPFTFSRNSSDPYAATQGESPRCPILVDAYGEGAPPRIVGATIDLSRGDGNFVMQNIDLEDNYGIDGIKFFGDGRRKGNVIFNKMRVEGASFSVQGGQYQEPLLSGITVRNVVQTDIWKRPEQKADYLDENDESQYLAGEITLDEARWKLRSDRQGMYFNGVQGLLIENNYQDQIGWHPLAEKYTGRRTGPYVPPSVYAQAIYTQVECRDVTLQRCIISRASANGSQLRGGGHQRDMVYVGCNIATNSLSGNYKNFLDLVRDAGHTPYRYTGQYTYQNGLLITHAGGKVLTTLGARAWGIDNTAPGCFERRCIVAHADDAANPRSHDFASIAAITHGAWRNYMGFSDTVVRNWGPYDQNLEGLDAAAMDGATLYSFTGAAGDNALDALRSLVLAQGTDTVRNGLLNHFRTAFGQLPPQHPGTPQTLRFLPDPLTDGVRWDTVENWEHGYLPSDGDSVDLGRSEVIYNICQTDLEALSSEGTLRVCGSRLSIQTADIASLSVEMVGDLLIQNGTIQGDLTLAGNGRITGGYIDLTGSALTLRPQDLHGAPEIRGGTVALGGCALIVDVTDWTGTNMIVPLENMSGSVGDISAKGLAPDRNLTVTVKLDRIELAMTAAGAGSGWILNA